MYQKIKNALRRHIEGTGSTEDQQLFNRFYHLQSDKRTEGYPLEDKESFRHSEQIFSKIKKQITVRAEMQRTKMVVMRRWVSLAAACISLLIGSGYVMQHPQVVYPYIMQEVSVRSGKLAEIILPDGSVVTLNSGSRLSYPRWFLGEARELSLSGEAFFEIIKNPDKPFVIHSGGMDTRVLGTSFNVRAYPQFERQIVSVATGKVAVSYQGQLLSQLLPQQQISVDMTSGVFSKSENVQIQDLLMWRTGAMHLEGNTLGEVCTLLQNRYGIVIKTETLDLSRGNITADFDAATGWREIISVLSTINQFDYTISNQTVELFPKVR